MAVAAMADGLVHDTSILSSGRTCRQTDTDTDIDIDTNTFVYYVPSASDSPRTGSAFPGCRSVSWDRFGKDPQRRYQRKKNKKNLIFIYICLFVF